MTKQSTSKKSKAKPKKTATGGNHKAVHKVLSKRELDILCGLANGSLYKEIAKDCRISIDTVKKHCKNIYRKLEARNRTEAIKNSGVFNISNRKIRPTRS
jgi:hypothetical protein